MNRPLPSLRYALRQLQLNPTFALVVIVSLALGIGANTAVFQLLDAVRLRSLPIHDPKELTEIKIVGGNHGFGVTNGQYAQLTRPIWKEIKQHHEPFSSVFAWSNQGQTVGRGSQSHPVQALEVSGEFFPVLGILPWRGRLFVPEDENSSCTISQVVVSYPYWQNQLGGRELGAEDTLLIEGHLAQVIGVTPPGFFGLAVGQSFDIAFPFCHEKEGHGEIFDISIMGRLRPGWSIERASAQMGALSPGIFEITAPAGYSSQAIQRFKQYRLGVYPAAAGVSQLRADYDSSLWLLLIITGLVLLIACANLANLMLARASAREREFAVRSALGASRIHLLGQSLSESCLLAVIGTTLGIGLAQVLSRVLVWALSTGNNTVILSTETDLRVLFFAASVALLTCIVFGLAPALRSMSAHPLGAIQSSRNMTGSRDRFSMQRLMVIMQISVSLVLLVGALLFIRSFNRLLTIDTGIRERGITLAFFGFAESHLPPASFEEFKRELLEEVRSVPGVQSAATTTNVPLLGGSWTHGIHIGTTEGWSKFAWVSPDYFKTMGIPLEMGRGFNQNDTATSPRVAVVNQAFIRQWVGRSNPIGQTLRTGEEPGYPSTVYQIVGVIPDTKYNDIRGVTPPMTFAPSSQFPAQGPWTAMMIYSESSSPEAAIKRKIAQNHPEIVTDFSDFQQDIRDGLVREKLLALLSGFFGILAALLAMVGLYGVIAYIVARRRQEIGIRVALGANRGQVVAMIMRESVLLLLIGVGVGTVLALVAGRGVESLLFGLKPHDPLVLFGSIGSLTVIAALASFLPAQRAARIDPMVALRYE